jgi:hypothetical protein
MCGRIPASSAVRKLRTAVAFVRQRIASGVSTVSTRESSGSWPTTRSVASRAARTSFATSANRGAEPEALR